MFLTVEASVCNARQQVIRDREWKLLTTILPPQPGRFLDVGCGTGYQMARAKAMGFEVSGIDPHPGTDGVHAELADDVRSAIQKGVATSLPFPDGHFDIVFSSHALVVMDDIPAVLHEMRRVLKRDGTLILVLDTAVMAWIKILSFALFDTHNRVRRFLRMPSRKLFRQIWIPPAYRSTLRSAWTETLTWRVSRWLRLLSPLYEVQSLNPTFLYTFPDYRPFFLGRHSKHLASAVVVTARPRPVVT